MEALTQEHITFLRIMGIPKEAAEIISNYFPKDNEDFGKNFVQSAGQLLLDKNAGMWYNGKLRRAQPCAARQKGRRLFPCPHF